MKTLFTILSIALMGCASTVPGAEKVLITSNPKDVVGCKVIAQPRGPYLVPDNDLRNEVYSLGGDTVLRNRQIGMMAYNCRGFDLRQPIPVKEDK